MSVLPTIRLALTTVLIVIVWFNAHWSVALSITALFVGSQFQGMAVRNLYAGFRLLGGSPARPDQSNNKRP